MFPLKFKFLSWLLLIVAFANCSFQKSAKDNWTEKQLMQPADLAQKINNVQTTNTVIFNIGPSGKIKNSIEIGPTQEKENLALLKKKLTPVSRNTEVVIYCGCCPFKNCPNIRPAIALLNDMKFANTKLLDLSSNLKTDWIDKGFPMQK